MSEFDNGLSPRATYHPGFTYEFLVFLIISGLLAIFFLLYFNRLFASIISYAIRTWTWHRYHVYIDIQALQISLLGGRIFFTGFRYHGSNESFLIQRGDITWRYWLRRVREASVLNDETRDGISASGRRKNASLPCRISAHLVGVEWFVYNRSPAYETVLAGLKDGDTAKSSSNDVSDERSEASEKPRKRNIPGLEQLGEILPSVRRSKSASGTFKRQPSSSNVDANSLNESRSSDSDSHDGEASSGPDLPFMLQLFPIRIECKTAAAVVGNENTKGILIIKANNVTCDVDAAAAPSAADPYRQLFDVEFDHPVIEMRDNEDYREDQTVRATKERDVGCHIDSLPRRAFFRQQRRRALNTLRNMVPYWRRSVESFSADSRADIGTAASHHPASNHWQGLSRYLEDRDQDDKARWASVEYAAETTILDSPAAHLTVFWDSVGKIAEQSQACDSPESLQHVNGGEPPAWGMHLTVKGGTVNYGPWADRLRADLQRVFMPGLAKDAKPAKPLAVGSWRLATQFTFLVELEDATTIRIPIREESKNWRWRGKEPPMDHQQTRNQRKQRNRAKKRSQAEITQTRPAGWLEFKVPADATVQYSMDMLGRNSAFKNTLHADLPGSELWSSVNHDVLWRSGAQKITCDLSNPLTWNTLRNWHFTILSDDLKLYLLRDHIFLLIDLVNDWASGPPSEYLVYTEYKYHLHLKFRNFQAFFNTNDGNVIDNATSLEENSYFILSSPFLTAETTIPLDKFCPDKNSIPFDVRADIVHLAINAPQWSTDAAFLSSGDLGHAEGLVVSGSYQFNATTSPANTDTLILNIHGQSPRLYLYGFVIRYLILLKDNYFGEHVHFRTLDEYQEQLLPSTQSTEAEKVTRPPYKKSNDLDVILSVKVDDPQVLLPTNVYSASRYIQGEAASFAVDLRFTNYYMDLELDISPLSLSLGAAGEHTDSPGLSTSNTQLFIDGIRVFGHRTFGLPPSEPTYLCNWDVSVGAVKGGCSPEFLSSLAKGGAAFGFTFDDVENALVPYSSLVFHDITFARVHVQPVSLWIHAAEAAFLLSTGAITVNSNDWASSHYSKRANINIRNLQISCVDAESVAKHSPARGDHPTKTDAYLQMDVQVGSIGRKANFSQERKTQQELVRREDQRTNRTPFFLANELLDEFVPEPVDAPAQCAPPPPYPLYGHLNDQASIEGGASRASHSLSGQRSFLSFSSSSASVRRHTPSTHSHSRSMGRRNTRQQPLVPLTKTTSHQSNPWDGRNYSYDHPSVSFSSPYFSPRFPMDGISPDSRDAAKLDMADESWEDPFRHPAAQLSDVDSKALSEDYGYSSSMIEFPSGISAFLSSNAVKQVTALLDILQPSNPEDILDNLQVQSMTSIFSSKKRQHAAGEIKDLLVRLPKAHVRFLNTSKLDLPGHSSKETDQYDVQISGVGLVTRTVTDRDGALTVPTKSRTSMQLRIDGVEASAAERLTSSRQAQPAMKFDINRVLVSIGAKEVKYLDADIGSVVGSTASNNVEYLAALVHRTGTIASELGHLLASSSSRHKNGIIYCCCRLLELGHSTNDPSFLIRPSAVLRSVDQHLRTSDSWKMIMRLRQIWATMEQDDRLHVTQSCAGTPPIFPNDAAERTIEAFQQWRSWDLNNPKAAVLTKKIFGNLHSSEQGSVDALPFLGACKLGEAKFVLDPGPRQNTVAITEVNARFERKGDSSVATMLKAGGAEQTLTTVNIYCGDVSIDLNWELCELAENVLKLYSHNSTPSNNATNGKAEKYTTQERKARSAFHIFLDVARSSVNLESINLRAINVLQGLKSSAVIYHCESGMAFNSLMMNCDGVISKAFSHSKLLWTFQLLHASVSVSQELFESLTEVSNVIKGTASSRGLSLEASEDLMTVLEVADLLVRDEGARLLRLRTLLPMSDREQKPEKIAERLSKLKLNIVMLLDGYSISLPLLQSLTYKVSGVVARAACAANLGKELIFDFDIKENSHDIQMQMNNKLRSISLLEMPPTNGRITSRTQDSEHVVTVLSSIEVIRLDASAIYSLLSALNRSQIAAEVQEIQDQVKAIQQHITEALGNNSSVPSHGDMKPPSSLKLVYDIRLALGGFQALTKTSLKSKGSSYAQLLFSLDKFHMQASNRGIESGSVLKYPELHLNLNNIGFDVRRGTINDSRSCGNLGASVTVSAGSRRGESGKDEWTFYFMSDDLNINLSPETVSTVVDILGYMGTRIKDLDTSRELDYLRKLRESKPRISMNDNASLADDSDILDSVLSSVVYRFQLRNIHACWDVAKDDDHNSEDKEDLHFSIQLIEFGTRSKKSARLTIERLQLQMVPPEHDRRTRSHHSALLPEVTFNVGYVSSADARRLAFQAIGKSLDLRLTSGFILPAANLVRSISLSTNNVRKASAQWMTDNSGGKQTSGTPAPKQRGTVFGNKRFESILIDADFAGAVVHVSGRRKAEDGHNRPSLSGKYGQFTADDSGSSAVLRSPGLAMKAEYRDDGQNDPSLHGEVKVDASSNILYPAVVPLVLDIVSNIKEVVSNDQGVESVNATPQPPKFKPEKSGEEDNILTADPSTVLGRLRLNMGLRICRQEFALSCQPIARVAAKTSFDHFYFTVNTIISQEQGNFFAISGILHKPQASVQHVYSRESTANFALDTVTLSFMNSKHVSGVSGVSAILNVSPMKVSVNARQLQDFMLFREIWYPEELRRLNSAPVAKLNTETSQAHLVQRYQQVAATAAFPWTATISIAALDVGVDLGQAIGKSVFQINEFWISSKKTSDWEQNLCLGFDKIGIDCTGRLSGFIALQNFGMRTSIQWPKREEALNETPLVQASLAFKALQIKAAFDYQAFLVADVRSLEFLMYNVRENGDGSGDRLVAIFDGDAIQMFGTTTSAAQGVAVYQAFAKLMQEGRENFEASLKEIEKFIKRKPNVARGNSQLQKATPKLPENDTMSKSPISLDTDVVVTLRALNLGVFPSTFSDHQVFKMEALNAYARFSASMEQRRIHSMLRMTLGQLRIGLAGVRNVEAPRTLSEMLVEDVVERSTGSRGGTILKVPRVEAVMETWQSPNKNRIEYKFKSAFEGKVEVGWNYSRISYIRGMWANHGKSLEEVWGRQLPMTAVKITGVPEVDGERKEGEQGKITAEVNVPQSKYDYTALEEPIIETPQLRDMGEATPPLEWIGLHRDRLPNLTHQIVIVTLLELAGEVEDAYSRILGSS